MDEKTREQFFKRKCRIRKVTIAGVKRTKTAILRAILCQPLAEVDDVDGMRQAITKATTDLQALGIFNGINITFDEFDDADDESDEVGVHVTALFKERGMLTFKAATMAQVRSGYAEPRLEASVGLRNALGSAETLTLSTKMGTQWSQKNLQRSFMFSYNNPCVLSDKKRNWQISAEKSNYSYPDSLFTTTQYGANVVFTQGEHSVGYEAAWRNISGTSGASFAIRNQCGHSLKSAIKHVWKVDTRDNPFTPRTGYAVQVKSEFAGLGGNVRFAKTQTGIQYNIPLFQQSSLNLLFRGGVIVPFNNDISRVVDRFSLGGATGLRGFVENSVGERSDRRFGNKEEYLGGDVFASASAHFTFPLGDNFPDWVRGHVFVDTGSIIPLNKGKNLFGHMNDLKDEVRASVGAGLLLRTVIGRVELNLAYPLKQDMDVIRHHQIGLCVEFL